MKLFTRILFFILFFFSSGIFCIRNRSSQSFMATRPVNFNIAAYEAFWHNIIYCNEDCLDTSGQLIGLFQFSSDKSDSKKSQKISEYFLMKNKPFLTVKGDNVSTSTFRDIRAEWLQLPDNFVGEFSLFPQQKQIGLIIDLKRDLSTYFGKDSFFGSFWVGISTAILSVDNDLNLKEWTLNNNFGQKMTVLDALRRSDLLYGKFCGRSVSMGFSEIRFKLGTEFIFREDFQVNAHTYLMFPLAEKQDPTFVFPAIRGFNGHIGTGTVVNFQFPMTRRCDPFLVALFLDVENIFLFRNDQWRSFDLLNKPWSRYMLFNKSDGTITNLPAINVLTRKVKVDPYCIVDLSAGFRYKKDCFEAELGYGVWAHADERLKFKSRFKEVWGIAAAPGEFTPDGVPATASTSTIAKLGKTDKDCKGNNIFVPIEENDIDINSGAARATITSRVHVAIGRSYRGEKCNGFFGFGAYFEFPQNNAALQQWGFWGKVGATF